MDGEEWPSGLWPVFHWEQQGLVESLMMITGDHRDIVHNRARCLRNQNGMPTERPTDRPTAAPREELPHFRVALGLRR